MLYELGHLGVVKICGDKSGEFLQGQFTCDVEKVTEHQASLGALCNPQGRVLAIFYLFKQAGEFFCIMPRSIISSFLQHLQKFAVFSRITLEDFTAAYSLYGSQEQVPLHNVINLTLPGLKARYILMSSSKLNEFPQADLSEWRNMDINAGMTFVYPETLGAATPHMLNLPKLGGVSFNKGCYVGQEIITRTHYLGKSKRHLCLCQIKKELHLSPGEIVQHNNMEAGLVMESGLSNSLTQFLAVLQEPLDREFFVKDARVEIKLQLNG